MSRASSRTLSQSPPPSAVPNPDNIPREEEEEEEYDNNIEEKSRKEMENESDWLLQCRSENPKMLVTLLQCLQLSSGKTTSSTMAMSQYPATLSQSSFGTNQATTIFATPNSGLTIHAQSNAQFQSTLELPSTMFSSFVVADTRRHKSHSTTTHDNDDDDDDTTTTTATGTATPSQDQSISFCVSWKTLLDCLAVLTIENPACLSLSYDAHYEILRMETSNHNPLVLHNSNSHHHHHHYGTNHPRRGRFTTTNTQHRSTSTASSSSFMASAAIPGLVPPEHTAELSAAFGASPVAARLLCASSSLMDITELDLVAGVTSIRLLFRSIGRATPGGSNHGTGILQLSVVGHSSRCQVQLPGPVELDNNAMDQKRRRRRRRHGNVFLSYSYPYMAWRRAMKPLELATETCLSVNQEGILAVQHQLLVGNNNTWNGNGIGGNVGTAAAAAAAAGDGSTDAAFCDCLIVPLVSTDDDDDDDEGDDTSTDSTHNDSVTLQTTQQSRNRRRQDGSTGQSQVSWQSQPPLPPSSLSLGATQSSQKINSHAKPKEDNTESLRNDSDDDDDSSETDVEAITTASQTKNRDSTSRGTRTRVAKRSNQPSQIEPSGSLSNSTGKNSKRQATTKRQTGVSTASTKRHVDHDNPSYDNSDHHNSFQNDNYDDNDAEDDNQDHDDHESSMTMLTMTQEASQQQQQQHQRPQPSSSPNQNDTVDNETVHGNSQSTLSHSKQRRPLLFGGGATEHSKKRQRRGRHSPIPSSSISTRSSIVRKTSHNNNNNNNNHKRSSMTLSSHDPAEEERGEEDEESPVLLVPDNHPPTTTIHASDSNPNVPESEMPNTSTTRHLRREMSTSRRRGRRMSTRRSTSMEHQSTNNQYQEVLHVHIHDDDSSHGSNSSPEVVYGEGNDDEDDDDHEDNNDF